MKDIISLDSPIDVQYLMHKAYCDVSMQVEEMAQDIQDGGDPEPFTEAFGLWGKHLLYHAGVEDLHMTGPLKNSQPARDNEAEHAGLARQAKEFVAFLKKGNAAALEASLSGILAFEEHQHQELERRLRDVEEVLTEEMNGDAVLARTRRHLYSRVVALRVAEFDHFENEEAFVFPVIRERLDERQQLEVARRLLFDEDSDDPRWIIDWLADALEPADRQLLTELEHRIMEPPLG
jgi:hypothetical protein